MRLRLIGMLALVVGLAGCSLAPSDKLLEQLGKSERSYCYTASYGGLAMVRLAGTGIQGGKMSCTNDGLTVEDMASRVGVPILLTPNFSIAPPTMTPTR